MWKACRPPGRRFCFALALIAGFGLPASGFRLGDDASRIPAHIYARPAAAAAPMPQSGPALTSVIDTVYLADGTPAQGTLVITWPAFTTASGTGVAAGITNVTLGTNGGLNVGLVPNAGAIPAGMYYTVVYQLGPGEVRTEYWVVPTTSPANLATVRTTPGSGIAAQPVSMQYVNTELATVVHLGGAETITGTKTFATPPSTPTPVNTGDVANKAYVDSSVANVGAGNFVPTAGGTMTGPLTLSGNPTAPLQAAAKQYVDATAAAKADLVSGLVPTAELGSGTATSLSCLLGSGAWGACGSSANAIDIQSVPVATTAPTDGQVLAYSASAGQYAPQTPSGAPGGVVTGPSASQNITQPAGTQLSVNNLSGIRYVTAADSWTASPSGSLIGGTPATVTLTPCPLGIDTSGSGEYYVYISGQGTPEAVTLTGGTCTSGAASGTVVFTPRNTHAATYLLSSASSGIQEAINDGCGIQPGLGNLRNANARIVTPPGSNLSIYGSVFVHCNNAELDFRGTTITTYTRDRAMVLGDLTSLAWGQLTLRGARFSPSASIDGCQITNTQLSSNVVTLTVSGCSTIQTGDTVVVDYTDDPAYWGVHGPITVSGSTITYAQNGANRASDATPGVVAVENAAIEDNANSAIIDSVRITNNGFKYNEFIVADNDQAETIRNSDSNGNGTLCTANHCGSMVYSAGNTQATPVIWIDKANWSLQCAGNGVTNYANNSVRITDSVIQGWGMWATYASNLLGSFGGLQQDNVYNEEGGGPCPSPYEGSYFSAAGDIFSSAGAAYIRHGGEGPGVHIPRFSNTGSTQYEYFVIARDTTQGVTSAPFFAGYAMTNGSGTISGQFPHIPPKTPGDTMVYDILRFVPSFAASNLPAFPQIGNCTGGSTTACGSVVTSQPQCAGLVCTFTDTASANTSSYGLSTPTWSPTLTFWPGALVLSGSAGQASNGAVFMDGDTEVVTTQPYIPQMYVTQCNGPSVGDNSEAYAGAFYSCLNGRPGLGWAGAWLKLTQGSNNSGNANLKGAINLFNSPGGAVYPTHLITLVDSNPFKTLATEWNRPPNDANDTYIGLDVPNGGQNASTAQLALGAPVAISSYIGNVGDNSSYKERLTAAGKTFNVPVTVNGNLTVTGVCTGCGGGGSGSGTVNSASAAQVAMYAANGTAVSGDSKLTDSGGTLSYGGSGGISAASGMFGGNVTVNGQLLVAGPWTVSSPIPGSAMGAALAGTSALGISNDGNFYVSANGGSPQKVATTATSSFFSNLTQEDTYDVGQFVAGETLTNPQNLHVYSSYANSSTWTRTSLGYDTADSYAVLRSESLPSGSAAGLGFWINSGLKWVIDGTNNFKPWTDQTYNIGSFNSSGSGSGLRPATVFVAGNSTSGSGLELGKFANESYELCNDGSTGTVINGLSILSTAGCAIKPSSALTSGAIGVVIANAGTSGVATLAKTGSVFCSFDATATAIGDYVVPSSTSGSYYLCHDAGATRPAGTQILGRVLQASSGSTTVQMFLDMPGSSMSGGTGSCTNQVVTAVNAGAPTCATVTSAYVDSSIAPTASPTLTGTPTAPTPATTDSSTKIATTAWVNAQGFGTGTGNVSGPATSTSADIATFNGTNGKTIQDSGTAVSSLAPLASPGLTGTPTAPTASAGDNSTKIATTAYVKSEIQLAWTCPVAGSTSVSQNCNWTLPAGLTITGFDFAANTAPAGCTTYPVVQLWDGTAGAEVGSYSVTLSSGNNFYTQVTGSTNVAGGHQLRVKVTTAASGCSTNAAGLVATVTYQMQN
jgi:hypothetical protein